MKFKGVVVGYVYHDFMLVKYSICMLMFVRNLYACVSHICYYECLVSIWCYGCRIMHSNWIMAKIMIKRCYYYIYIWIVLI